MIGKQAAINGNVFYQAAGTFQGGHRVSGLHYYSMVSFNLIMGIFGVRINY